MPLAIRDVQPEVMDQPGLDAALHEQALHGLRRINRLSHTAGAVWKSIRKNLGQCPQDSEPLRILDVACGGGDVALELARLARRDGVSVQITGCDISPRAVEFASRQARAAGAKNVDFIIADVLQNGLPDGHDVVTCSLFLHHLDENTATLFLRRAAAVAGRLLVISDLCRSRAGWVLGWMACRVLTRSPIVRTDGPMSIAAAFTKSEAAELAHQAGLADARVSRCWPQRYLLVWKRM